MGPTPEAAAGRFPLKGATLADWQSQIRGVCWGTDLPLVKEWL